MSKPNNILRIIDIPSNNTEKQPTQSRDYFPGYDAKTATPRMPRCVRARGRTTGSYLRRAA